ncbi:ketopantoate reductase family protein [Acidiphilium sp. JA12-A1]|uniref:ketopantoate reductase family protein n=1 Tax=Acidiphilium sp. JA12-A1 TaxID=1464546 RepID=UPI000460C9F3|nr:ketopantoate reductase family protein [Acidiphilium sp. JA12-A1]KDM66071.1 2-dehydropantoate 2-reductase [Acidiphilium sp. JA12-A1]
MRLLVVGAGSTGGYIGGRLAHIGRDVTFLVRPARAADLRERGLRIVSPHGDITLYPKVVTAGQITTQYDAVLLTVKGFHLDAAVSDLGPAVGPETMILPVLNGMQHVYTLVRRFSPHSLIGCTLKVATILEDDGHIVQLTPLQELAYGEWHGRITGRITELDQFMQGASIGARLSNAIRREMWEKWILLSVLGASTCFMRGTIGDIEACSGGSAFVLGLFDEIVNIVSAIGDAPSDDFLKSTRVQLMKEGSLLTSSMFRDLQRNRPIEVENIVGDLVRRGIRAGLEAPLLSAAYVHLRIYQNHIASIE